MEDAEKRLKAVAVVNVALADVVTAEQRLAKAQDEMRRCIERARVEIGTARSELARKVGTYDTSVRDLRKLMPTKDYPPDFVELMREFGDETKLLDAAVALPDTMEAEEAGA